MRPDEFVNSNKGLSKKETERRVREAAFGSPDWIEVHEQCYFPPYSPYGKGLHNLKVAALKEALRRASSLADWVCIAEHVKAPYRNRAFDEILKFNITNQDDINLLLHSSSDRLQSVGWYLNGRHNRDSQ